MKVGCTQEPTVIGHEVGKIKNQINLFFPLICTNFASVK